MAWQQFSDPKGEFYAPALKAGEQAVPFSVDLPEDGSVTLEDLIADGPLILYFYRGIWCGDCRDGLVALRDIHKKVRNFGGRVLALSPNLPEFAARIREELELPFIVASDPGNRIADKYGLKLTLFDEERKSLIENKNVNLHTYNGNNDWTLPVTARYVIRPDGYVQYVYANLDHTIAPDYSKLLAMVKKAAEA